MHMHRARLRKAYQQCFYKVESGLEMQEVEQFQEVLGFRPSQSVETLLTPRDPVKTPEKPCLRSQNMSYSRGQQIMGPRIYNF